MEFEDQFSRLAVLLGDRSRSVMLWNLLDGRAYTATELSHCADISAQSASNHLSQLISSGILKVEKQGRHRYYRFANAGMARVIESMAGLLPPNQKNLEKEKVEPEGFRYARTCYDHLAGCISVKITNSLLKKRIIKSTDNNYEVSRTGIKWFLSVGIQIDEVKLQKRSFAYPCLDWSERNDHLAGALGAALLKMMLHEDWVRRNKNSRQVIITAKGKAELRTKLDIEL